MLASNGEITNPCPVPLSLTDTTPSSRRPAFNHFWIRRMMRWSPIRCSRKRISHSWLISSKNDRMSASSMNLVGAGEQRGRDVEAERFGGLEIDD